LIGDEAFARSLAEALGPLYRISLVDRGGKVRATFGTMKGDRVACRELDLPNSDQSLLVEFDLAAVDRADRVLRALAPRPADSETPTGSFTSLDGALSELISLAENQIGRPMSEMSRAEKQAVVRFLDERSAFTLRKSVETVADALGVSRFTVYNYLDSSRQENGEE
jgi:hypothetical protein